MPDEEIPENPEEPKAPEPPKADPAVESLTRQVQALNDTVHAALQSRAPANITPGAQGVVTPQLRHALRQKGMSDANIDANAELIMPFIEVFAPELVGLVESRIGGVDERISRKEMEDDSESFPYAKDLRSEIKKVTADAKKEGKTLSLEAAYHTAVSLNLDKVRTVDTQRRAESAGADASALGDVGHRGSSNASRRAGGKGAEPKTRAELETMTREQRMEYYEKYGDTPVH